MRCQWWWRFLYSYLHCLITMICSQHWGILYSVRWLELPWWWWCLHLTDFVANDRIRILEWSCCLSICLWHRALWINDTFCWIVPEQWIASVHIFTYLLYSVAGRQRQVVNKRISEIRRNVKTATTAVWVSCMVLLWLLITSPKGYGSQPYVLLKPKR